MSDKNVIKNKKIINNLTALRCRCDGPHCHGHGCDGARARARAVRRHDGHRRHRHARHHHHSHHRHDDRRPEAPRAPGRASPPAGKAWLLYRSGLTREKEMLAGLGEKSANCHLNCRIDNAFLLLLLLLLLLSYI